MPPRPPGTAPPPGTLGTEPAPGTFLGQPPSAASARASAAAIRAEGLRMFGSLLPLSPHGYQKTGWERGVRGQKTRARAAVCARRLHEARLAAIRDAQQR